MAIHWSFVDDFPRSKLTFAISPSLSLSLEIRAPFEASAQKVVRRLLSPDSNKHNQTQNKSMQRVALNLSRYVMKSGVANLVQRCSTMLMQRCN